MKILITGAAGFIGSNFARLASADGHELILLDNFSRPRADATAHNLFIDLGLKVEKIDIRDRANLENFLLPHSDIQAIWHLAGQVSYQKSIDDPVSDFETNANGTQNLLELARKLKMLQVFIFASTNKVYGDLSQLTCEKGLNRFVMPQYPFGITEEELIDPAGPYGSSKYAAEQLCKIYSETYSIPTLIFRQSSISGERQYATDDQGWISYFTEKFVTNEEYYFTGEGLQVRDILHFRDLFNLFVLATQNYQGFDYFNVGGGIKNSISILELINTLEKLTGNSPVFTTRSLRSKDQLFFVSNNKKVLEVYKWAPKISKDEIIIDITTWFKENNKKT